MHSASAVSAKHQPQAHALFSSALARYILPPLRFLNMDWPERYLRRPTLSPRRKKTPQRQDNDEKSSDENNTEDKSPNDDDGSGKAAPVPRAGLHVLSDFPKQFVLSSRQEEGAIAILDLDRSLSENDAIHWVPRPSRDICSELRKIAKEVESFEGKDKLYHPTPSACPHIQAERLYTYFSLHS